MMALHMQVERQVCLINDVVPRRQQWKVFVQVLERKKKGVSRSAANPTEYRGYILVDTVGTLVSAVCYGGDVAYFDTSLMPYKRYYISNAYVKPVKQGYEVGEYRFAWTLFNTTPVQPVDEAVPPALPYNFQFKRFSDLFRYADRETTINIKGYIVEAFPEKKVGRDSNGQLLIAQDFVVIDTEKIPMLMRLWKEKIREYADVITENVANGILFVGMNMKVTTFNGLTLSSRLNTVLLKDPIIHESSALKEWYTSAKEVVAGLLSNKAYKNTNMLIKKPAAEDIMPILNAMAAIETTKTAWITGKLKLIEGQDKYWYMCCKNCQRALRPGHTREMPCISCDEEDPIHYKCHIGVYVTDDSATAYGEIYSPDVEELIPYTALQLKEAEDEGRFITPELEAALENKHVVCYIKYFNKLVRGVITKKFPLIKIYLYNDVFGDGGMEAHNPSQAAAATLEEIVDLTKHAEDDVQLFTPSTKKLIEQISDSTQNAITEEAGASSCKRVLAFEDGHKHPITVKIEPVDDSDVDQTMVMRLPSLESPGKKCKSKVQLD